MGFELGRLDFGVVVDDVLNDSLDDFFSDEGGIGGSGLREEFLVGSRGFGDEHEEDGIGDRMTSGVGERVLSRRRHLMTFFRLGLDIW